MDWLTQAWVMQALQPHLVCSHRTAAALHLVEVLGPAHTRHASEFTDPAPAPTGAVPAPASTASPSPRPTGRSAGPPHHHGRPYGRRPHTAAPRDEAVAAADSALATRTVRGSGGPVTGRLRAPRRAGHVPPRSGARPLLAAPHRPRSGSPAETVARLHFHDAGLHPETQATLRTPGGRTLRPDFFFRAQGLVVEVEGYAFHGTREAHTHDLHRFNALQSCPEVRRVIRFTATEVFHHPTRVLTETRTALTP
ncbi:hypothetical protein NKH18_32890 [Streptomyces sp. M10(2022)]